MISYNERSCIRIRAAADPMYAFIYIGHEVSIISVRNSVIKICSDKDYVQVPMQKAELWKRNFKNADSDPTSEKKCASRTQPLEILYVQEVVPLQKKIFNIFAILGHMNSIR